MNLGGLKLSSNVILSPLERVSDIGFRRLCFQNGAALTWTEMIYASELVRRPGKNETNLSEARAFPRGGRGAKLIDTLDPETLTGVQIIVDRTTARDGWGTDLLKAALEQLEEGAAMERPEWNNIVAVDLNFGCPAPALSRRGAGPAQLRRRSKIRALFEVLHEWKLSTSLPIQAVGAKIRLGNNEREKHFKVYLPVAEAAAENLDYLTVHARHAEQRSRDPPTWDAIREIKESVKDDAPLLKIIGNGDIRTREDVQKIQQETGCDGVMIGRAAMRNPWCFRHLTGEVLNDNEWPEPAEVEQAFQENEALSSVQPADTRYRRFRNENFIRLRQEALRAQTIENSTSLASNDRENIGLHVHSDWYVEWSKASSRRRHLEKMDDEEMHRQASAVEGGNAKTGEEALSVAGGSWRRTTNQRSWKARRKGKEKK